MGHLSRIDDLGEVLLNKVLNKASLSYFSSQQPSPIPQTSLNHLSVAVTNLLIKKAIYLLSTGSFPHYHYIR